MNCVLYISLLQVDPYPISPFVTWCACTTSAALRSQHGGVWQVPLCVWRSSWQHFTLRSIQVWGHQRPILSSSPLILASVLSNLFIFHPLNKNSVCHSCFSSFANFSVCFQHNSRISILSAENEQEQNNFIWFFRSKAPPWFGFITT